VQDRDHGWQTFARDIKRVFIEQMRSKYRPIHVDEECQDNVRDGIGVCASRLEGDNRDANYGRRVESSAVQRNGNKSPGRDVIGQEFFKIV